MNVSNFTLSTRIILKTEMINETSSKLKQKLIKKYDHGRVVKSKYDLQISWVIWWEKKLLKYLEQISSNLDSNSLHDCQSSSRVFILYFHSPA